MNRRQRVALWIVAGVVAMMLLIPPFHLADRSGSFNMGYSFLLTPPKLGYSTASVNYGTLLTQWVGVCLIGGIAFIALKDR